MSEFSSEIAHILMMDLVGFSLRPIDEQITLTSELRAIVRATPEMRRAQQEREVISLDLGDGMALVFHGDPRTPVKCAVEIARALKDHPELRLRMGIHSGPISRQADINERVNVTGGGINTTQRVMDCGDAGHILLSQSAAEVMTQYAAWTADIGDLGPCAIKHGGEVRLYNLTPDGLGNPEVPARVHATRRRSALRANLRAAAVYVPIILIVALLAAGAAVNAGRARTAARLASEARGDAELKLYAADIHLAMQDYAAGVLSAARERLDALRPQPGRPDRRGFEWRLLWALCQGDDIPARRLPVPNVALAAFAPNGKWAAVPEPPPPGSPEGAQGRLKLIDADTGETILRYEHAGSSIDGLAFSADSRLVACTEDEGLVRVWRTDSTAPPSTFQTALKDPGNLHFSPDGRSIVLVGRERHGPDAPGHVEVWFLPEGRRVLSTQPAVGIPVCAVFSPDGRELWVGTQLGGLVEIDVASGTQAPARPAHTDVLRDIAFSPSGVLATAGFDWSARLWSTHPLRLLQSLHGHQDAIGTLAFSPDGKLLATAGGDTMIKLWRVESGTEHSTLRGHDNSISSVAFTPNGILRSFSPGEMIRSWPASSHHAPNVLLPGGPLRGAAYSADGQRIAVSTLFGEMSLYSADGTRIHGPTPRGNRLRAVAFSPDLRFAAMGGMDGTTHLLDLETGAKQEMLSEQRTRCSALAFTPDGKLLAVGTNRGRLRIWDMAAGKLTRELSGHEGAIIGGAAFSPSGDQLATVDAHGQLLIWALPGFTLQRKVEIRTGGIDSVAYSRDARLLAIGGQDRILHVFRQPDFAEIATLKGHRLTIMSIAFSPDGRTLATGSGDNTVKLWSLTVGQEVATLAVHKNGISAVAFHPDGNTLLTGSTDGTVRLWRAAKLSDSDPPHR